jgi:tripartite-type tricarboxylate transporter receptor subunit TctC
MHFRTFVAFALATYGALAAAADTAESYPARPVRMIVPLPPGGGTDLLARGLAQQLASVWGRSVIVDNRGGAGGVIGVDLIAKAAPDGYTVGMGYVAPISVNVHLSKLPYDPVRDLTAITMVAQAQNVLALNPLVPAGSVKELIAYLKSKPGQISYASAGIGSSPHLSAELFKQMTGTDMTHVPYKGAGPALVDVISGQVALYFGSLPSVLPHAKSGKVKVLGVTGSTRSQVMPELPTISEAGVRGFESLQWYGLFAPAKVARSVVEKVYADVRAVLRAPDVHARLTAQGFEVVESSPRQFADFVRNDIDKWGRVIRHANIRPE